ncbi:MAG: sigma-70 family RNA polymerase sigma factor [Planctomycetales bacterium]|nr:sigma-70 family RNA polymerase sigma factor [Planctomycetales bacterium]
MNDDALLIAQTLDGESNAFGRLVRRYQDRLFGTMAHLTGCPEEAEDVVQEAFVQAFVRLETFGGRSSFYTWLYRIAFNVSASRQRRRRPRVSLDELGETRGLDPVADGARPEAALDADERAALVHRALETLSEEHRAVLVLREMEDCDYETIAEVLEIPVGTVRSRLSRARSQLRDRLRDVLAPDSRSEA